MKNTFRQSKTNTILKELEGLAKLGGLLNILEEIEQELGNNKTAKELFFENLTPYGYEAHKLAFQVIEYKYESCKEEKDWKEQFIAYHDFIISLLKQGGDTIFNFATVTFTTQHINEVFRQDTRSLDEIMESVFEKYHEAITGLENGTPCECCASESENELEVKLKAQLEEVTETLKQLTDSKEGLKLFEIELEKASFSVLLND